MFLKSFKFGAIAGLGLVGLMAALLIPSLPLPARAQDPTPLQKIESDDPAVLQAGTWLSQPALSASGGSYLYNSGEAALELQFSGPSVVILYVAGPSLGTLAIEVDGNVLRTVITTTTEVRYQQSAKIDYLTDEAHTLRIYAQAGGVIGVDAFITLPPKPMAQAPNTMQTSAAPLSTRITCDPPTAYSQLLSFDGRVPRMSADSRYIVFESNSNSLIPGQLIDINSDVFLLDRQTCAISLISQSDAGQEADAHAGSPNISADGRYIFYYATDSDLVPNDTNGEGDVFVYDRVAGDTSIAVRTANGDQPIGVSSDIGVSVSVDGRYLTFGTLAYNFVPGDLSSSDGYFDVFWRDRQTGETILLSANATGDPANWHSSAPVISADGRYVAYFTLATDIIPVDSAQDRWILLYDHQTNTTIQLSCPAATPNSSVSTPSISENGAFLAYRIQDANPLNPNSLCIYEIATGQMSVLPPLDQTFRIGSLGTGHQVRLGLSNDGRHIAFEGSSTDFGGRPVWLYDRQTGALTNPTLQHTLASYPSGYPQLTGDGRYLLFGSDRSWRVRDLTQPVPAAYPDTLAIFRPEYDWVMTLDQDASVLPPIVSYNAYVAGLPFGGTWVMGDWDGDGDETPGVYTTNYAFYYTNDFGPTSNWTSIWIGLAGASVLAGRVDNTVNHDCIAFPDNTVAEGYRIWAVYWTCSLTSNPTPVLQSVYLGPMMGDHHNLEGETQFALARRLPFRPETLVVRRNEQTNHFVAWAWTNEPLNTTNIQTMQEELSSYGTINQLHTLTEYGTFLMGDWDDNGSYHWGIVTQSGRLYYSNLGYDVNTWAFGVPMGLPMQAVTIGG